MNINFSAIDKAEAKLVANNTNRSAFKIGGIFEVSCFDKDGNLKWVERKHNIFTNEGLNHVLNVILHGDAAIGTWYVGLKNTGVIAPIDTMSSHAGWTEFTDYTGNRQEYIEDGSAVGGFLTNAGSPASFAITGTGQVYGAFLTGDASGSSAPLLCGVDFDHKRDVYSGDELNVTYGITALNGD